MRSRAALNLLYLVLFGAPARADWVMGRVVAIADGDTLTVLTAHLPEEAYATWLNPRTSLDTGRSLMEPYPGLPV